MSSRWPRPGPPGPARACGAARGVGQARPGMRAAVSKNAEILRPRAASLACRALPGLARECPQKPTKAYKSLRFGPPPGGGAPRPRSARMCRRPLADVHGCRRLLTLRTAPAVTGRVEREGLCSPRHARKAGKSQGGLGFCPPRVGFCRLFASRKASKSQQMPMKASLINWSGTNTPGAACHRAVMAVVRCGRRGLDSRTGARRRSPSGELRQNSLREFFNSRA